LSNLENQLKNFATHDDLKKVQLECTKHAEKLDDALKR
jgi:hypothetical protein